MAGETTVGSIVGFLRLDGDQFRREVQQAIAQLERLDGRNVDIDVTVDRTGAAAAQVAATSKAVDHLGSSSQRSGRHMRGLVTAVLALGPALVPLGAGAVGLAAAFGGMGAAGVAAIFGIKSEMEAGTEVGEAYRDGLDSLKESFGDLSRVAAQRMLGDFQAAVRDLNARTPQLSRALGDMASVSGKTGAALTSGLVSAFLALEPLMRDASVYVLDLSRRFQSAMSGPGIREFGDYVRSVFPQVMEAIESIVGAASHLIAALAPLGMGTLTMLRVLSDVISALPVDVLSALAVTASSVFFGFKSWQGLSVLIGGVGTAMQRLGVQASTAATALRGLNIAAGIIGVAVAGLSLILASSAEEQRRNEQATNDYADALRESNGVIDESIRKVTAKRLADQGAYEAGRQLGIGVGELTDAALGNESALTRVNAVLDTQKSKLLAGALGAKGAGAAHKGHANEVNIVSGALKLENEGLEAGVQKHRDIEAATRATSTATSAAALEAERLAGVYGVSAATYQATAAEQQKIAEKAASATLQMQLENDAAGLLKQTLDLLNGEAMSAAQAQNSFDRAMLAVGNSTRDAEGKIDKAKTTLKGTGEAAVTNRGNLLNLANGAALVAEAFGAQADSSEAGRQKLITLRKQIIDNAVAQGMNRDEVTAFIDEVLKIPPKAPPTKAELDIAAAKKRKDELQAYINTLTGKTVVATVITRYLEEGTRSARTGRGRLAGNESDGGSLRKYAGGGKITGPGTGTNDRIRATVMQSGAQIAVSADEYLSTAASTRRNEAALAAGNRGATLTVANSGDQGPVELGPKTIRRLADALAGVRVTAELR